MIRKKTAKDSSRERRKRTKKKTDNGHFDIGNSSTLSKEEMAGLIRQLQNTEKALRESEKKYHTLNDNIPVGIFRTCPDGKLLSMNPALIRMLGYDSEGEMLSIPAASYYADPERRRELLERLNNDGVVTDFEILLKRKDGSTVWVSESVRAVADGKGRFIYLDGIVEDITQRKKNEEQHLQMEASMRQAQKFESLNIMAGSIAHNFNNLLMAIMGNIDLALEDMTPDAPGRRNIENANLAAERAAELSRLMLTYVGQSKQDIHTLDMSKIVEGMTAILKVTTAEKAEIMIDTTTEPALFNGDAAQVQHVIINLVTNAVEAIHHAKGTVTISTGAMFLDRSYFKYPFDETLPEGDYVYLDVTDNGCGMDRETLSKIFDPFFTTRFLGRGLGLASVLGIIRSHKGTAQLKSEQGEGTSVRVFFPTSTESVEPAIKIEEEVEAWSGMGTVLLVDDEDLVLELGKDMLEELGFNVLTAADGVEAVDLFQEHQQEIVCVILDIVMPRKDGKETFYELRALKEDVRVVFCSGCTEEQVTRQFDNVLPAPFIEKPFRLTDLAMKMKEVLTVTNPEVSRL
jgi:PAS domain S-box-containing protein